MAAILATAPNRRMRDVELSKSVNMAMFGPVESLEKLCYEASRRAETALKT